MRPALLSNRLGQRLSDIGGSAGGGSSLLKWALKRDAAEAEAKRRKEEDAKGLAPVGSLMFTEIERRIDVIIFRACLAHSVYEARRLVVHGDVLLNGKKVRRIIYSVKAMLISSV